MNKMYVLTETIAIEISDCDLPEKMEWSEALNEAIKIGDRWRLPTKEELNKMYILHKKAVGNFENYYYWSSEGFNNRKAYARSLLTGGYVEGVSVKAPNPKYLVRLVRNI